MKYPIFISYKRDDKVQVLKLKDVIESQTGVKCWIDIDGIESDAYFDEVICEAIKDCDIFLFFYSKSHLKDTNGNSWPANELRFANDRNKHIVLVFLDDTKLTDKLDLRYGSKQRVFINNEKDRQILIRDINKWLGKQEKETDSKASPKNASMKEWKEKGKVLTNMWNQAQKTVSKTQEAYKNIVPDFKEWFFSKDEDLPKSLVIKTEDDKICFVLSEDEKYYMANINQKSDNFAWWNNKTIAVVGASALLVGAPVLVAVGFGIAGLVEFLIPKSLTKLFSKNIKTENAPIVKVTKEICAKLSEATGYVIDLPTSDELKGVSEDAMDSCLVIRVIDNKTLFQNRD